MPSSTSSSEPTQLVRTVPERPWPKLLVVSICLTLALTGGWELLWRSRGYEPGLNDNPGLWAIQRAVVEAEPKRTVLIGASRTLYDFDLALYEELTGVRLVQLATVGSNPLPYLEDLAAQPDFAGNVIVGVVPGLFFAPGGPPVKNTRKNIDHFEKGSPSEQVGQQIGMFLERRLAFMEEGDLALGHLLESLRIPNRPAAKVRPELPPHFHTVDDRRQGRMTQHCEESVEMQKRIQQIWLPLFTPPPPPPHLDKAGVMKMVKGFADGIVARAKKAVATIVGRGGKVVFVRCPCTGVLRDYEKRYSPRPAYWDRLLRETGAPGVHFEDHEELNVFVCPEWSHLTRADASKFTRRVAPLIQKALQQ